MNTISLHEYQLSCPAVSAIPTITQSGLIGPILDRRHRGALRKMRRRAKLVRLLNLPVESSLRFRGLFTALFQRGAATIFSPSRKPQSKTP